MLGIIFFQRFMPANLEQVFSPSKLKISREFHPPPLGINSKYNESRSKKNLMQFSLHNQFKLILAEDYFFRVGLVSLLLKYESTELFFGFTWWAWNILGLGLPNRPHQWSRLVRLLERHRTIFSSARLYSS